MEDSASNMVLLLEYAKLLKSARELQIREIETKSFQLCLLSAQTTVKTREAAQEVAEFVQNPLGHAITQVHNCLVFPPLQWSLNFVTVLVDVGRSSSCRACIRKNLYRACIFHA